MTATAEKRRTTKPARGGKTVPLSEAPQVGKVYTRQQIMDAMGWRRRAWTAAIAKGMRVHKHGNKLFVSGSELIRFIESLDMQGEPNRPDCPLV